MFETQHVYLMKLEITLLLHCLLFMESESTLTDSCSLVNFLLPLLKIQKVTISSSKNWLGSWPSPKFSCLGSFISSESLIPKPNLSQIEQISPLGFQVVNNNLVRKIWCPIFSAASFYVAVPSN